MDLVDVRQIGGDGSMAEWFAREPVTGRPLYVRWRGALSVEAGPPGAPPDDAVGGEVLLATALGDGWRPPEWGEIEPFLAALPVPVAAAGAATAVPRRCAVRVRPPGGLRDTASAAGYVLVEEIGEGVVRVGYVEVDALGARTFVRARTGKHRHRLLAVVEPLLADVSDGDGRWLAETAGAVRRETGCCPMFGEA